MVKVANRKMWVFPHNYRTLQTYICINQWTAAYIHACIHTYIHTYQCTAVHPQHFRSPWVPAPGLVYPSGWCFGCQNSWGETALTPVSWSPSAQIEKLFYDWLEHRGGHPNPRMGRSLTRNQLKCSFARTLENWALKSSRSATEWVFPAGQWNPPPLQGSSQYSIGIC